MSPFSVESRLGPGLGQERLHCLSGCGLNWSGRDFPTEQVSSENGSIHVERVGEEGGEGGEGL